MVDQHQRESEASCRGERGLEAPAHSGRVKQMEELVDCQEVSAAATSPPAISGLEEKLKEETAEDLDLLLRHTWALTEKDKKWIAFIEHSPKVQEILGTEHEPEVFCEG